MGYKRNVLVAIDQLLNALFGGHPDETLSSRWGQSHNPIAGLAARILNKIDPDHAFDAIERWPGTSIDEPHHLAEYEKRRVVEEAALKLALERDDLTDFAMEQADMAAKRQRFREEARDRMARRHV